MNPKRNQSFAHLFIILGASFWGVTGLFVENLYEFGFTPWQVVAVRLSISSLILFIMLAIMGRRYLKIRLKDIPSFIGLGIVSIAMFNWCYFEVIERASLSVAVIFVYLSPVFTAAVASLLYKEKITFQKITAILFTLLGCGLVIEFFPIGGVSVSGFTMILGTLSGLFCSSFSIIGKYMSELYHPLTLTLYSLIPGSAFMVPTSSIWEQGALFLNREVWIYILGISIISTIFAYILFTLGLSYVESSKASILSSFELVVSVMVGLLLLNEVLTRWQVTGFFFVFLSLFLTVFTFRKKWFKRYFYNEASAK
ncbi:DMT family transporter [Salipaludibacillus daqingensis]|uniref:DMT family transporter n=1 Tax=Salipaludibacillus daqingensis TaxID=3041001 RepID=UPI00247376F3|nr:DMT family transporter [Salipaludibacillus daqingensis]